jgi:hypothetical protein
VPRGFFLIEPELLRRRLEVPLENVLVVHGLSATETLKNQIARIGRAPRKFGQAALAFATRRLTRFQAVDISAFHSKWLAQATTDPVAGTGGSKHVSIKVHRSVHMSDL